MAISRSNVNGLAARIVAVVELSVMAKAEVRVFFVMRVLTRFAPGFLGVSSAPLVIACWA